MQTAVCAIAKLENNYIREWVEYYLSIGFNKIILYDNNDIEGEELSSPLSDYIKSGQVDIIDARGKKGYQVEAYDDCYQKYKSDVDWILFADIDEFLTITSGIKINEFLAQEHFNKYNVINFQWCHYTDNDYVTVENNNYSVLTRFTDFGQIKMCNRGYKMMVRTNIPDLRINSVHRLSTCPPSGETNAPIFNNKEVIDNIKCCNSNGEDFITFDIDVAAKQSAYLKHFKYKTIEEYLEFKIKRGYPMPFLDYGTQLNLTAFFNINKLTTRKIEYIKQWLEKSDLPEIRKKRFLEELEYLPKNGMKIYDD